MSRDHRIVPSGNRCRVCMRPVGYHVLKVRCECKPDPETYWPCLHVKGFYRHYPERRP